MSNDVGTALKNLRLKRNISQKKLAEQVGLTQQAIALIENGKRKVDFDLFLNIVDKLDYPIDEVINDVWHTISEDNFDTLCKHMNNVEINSFMYLLKNCNSSLFKTSNDTYELTFQKEKVCLSKNELYNLMDDIFYYSEGVIRRFVYSKHRNSTDYFLSPKAARNDYLDEPGEIEKTYDDISSLKRPE